MRNQECTIKYIQWKSIEDEVDGICNYLQNIYLQKDINPKDYLIISPRRDLGFSVNKKLNEIGVPSKSYFSESIFNRNSKIIEECSNQIGLTLLSLIINPEDRVSLRCWLGFGSSNFLKNEYQNLINASLINQTSPNSLLRRIIDGSISVKKNIRRIVERYKELMNRIGILQKLDLMGKFDNLFPEETNWKYIIRERIENDEIITINQLFENIIDSIIAQEVPIDVDHIRIMSIHKAKGLTVRNVIILGCNDGLIPTFGQDYGQKSEIDQRRIIEEQRRLFFVAITRAEEELIISNSYNISRDFAEKNLYSIQEYRDGVGIGVSSRFIKELGPNQYKIEKGEEFNKSYQSSD